MSINVVDYGGEQNESFNWQCQGCGGSRRRVDDVMIWSALLVESLLDRRLILIIPFALNYTESEMRTKSNNINNNADPRATAARSCVVTVRCYKVTSYCCVTTPAGKSLRVVPTYQPTTSSFLLIVASKTII